MAGFIKERQVSQGQFLRANSPVVTIVQNSPLKLRVDVPESAVAHGSGWPACAAFMWMRFPDRVFEGRISRIAPSVDQQSRTLKLEALVNNSDGTLKAGFLRARHDPNRSPRQGAGRPLSGNLSQRCRPGKGFRHRERQGCRAHCPLGNACGKCCRNRRRRQRRRPCREVQSR